jgi:hypothetical protein
MAKSWLFNRRKYMPSKALTGLQSLKPGERSISEHSPPGLNVGPVMTHRISTPQNSTVSQHLYPEYFVRNPTSYEGSSNAASGSQIPRLSYDISKKSQILPYKTRREEAEIGQSPFCTTHMAIK